MPTLIKVAAALMLPLQEVHACVIASSEADLSPAAHAYLKQSTCF